MRTTKSKGSFPVSDIYPAFSYLPSSITEKLSLHDKLSIADLDGII